MSNVESTLDEPWSEHRFKSELAQCAGPCGGSAFNWLAVGAFVYPYLAKRGLERYVGFQSRLLIATVSAVLTSFYMGYRSKTKCEENIRRLYAEKKEKEREKLEKEASEKEASKKVSS